MFFLFDLNLRSFWAPRELEAGLETLTEALRTFLSGPETNLFIYFNFDWVRFAVDREFVYIVFGAGPRRGITAEIFTFVSLRFLVRGALRARKISLFFHSDSW